jgi:GDP-L-fucose synthase
VKSIAGFTGNIGWDRTKPDGTFRKLLDVSKMREAGITGFLSLEEGIRQVYKSYVS